jgi:3-methyladenine DNA glycosylase/8-oxoguanine DNA glycosylase
MTARRLSVPYRFDLARTAAPVWWGRGRWPNVDWRDGRLSWVGWEDGSLVWRTVAQIDRGILAIEGSASRELDRDWSSRVLGTEETIPHFSDPVLNRLLVDHAGMGMWSAGSLYEGFVSSVVGQSISVAAAAVTEARLYSMFHSGIDVAGRRFWPAPRPEQLAESEPATTRASGITWIRAEALRAIGFWFGEGGRPVTARENLGLREQAEELLSIRGVGRWTIESALLWGVGDPDAHPSGDVALLRAARAHYPEVETLRDLDRRSEQWRPHRAWAARLLWVDLLGYSVDLGADGDPP